MIKKKSTFSWLRNFFANYFMLGVLLILLAILLAENNKDCSYEIGIAAKTIESIGIAILIASIFTFASGTNQFIGKIKEILKDIVVSRNFLNRSFRDNLCPSAKSLY